MSRIKIDYGIDLGTTNSAIARMVKGNPIIIKSDTLKDTMPSCVSFNRRGDCLVGDSAMSVLKNDFIRSMRTFERGTTSTFIEFKRTMGKDTKYSCHNLQRELTSEELSAEVLKKLKSFVLDENNISSIVITVPAKFSVPQNEATIRAAKMAGFEQVVLLQEPIAAVTAYSLAADKKDGFWLVFDFGGGTFDVALIESQQGFMQVKDTEGDNFLGGKNLDDAIVDRIIIPYLKDTYTIDDKLNNPEKREILRKGVKRFAEDAKNAMSFIGTTTILSEEGDIPFRDEFGIEIEIDIPVTQKDMERVLSPVFQKAIDITKELLARNNLAGNKLDALILVGGPTHSPILRRMLKEQITENVDTSVDPMTVVAKGAALYASTVDIDIPTTPNINGKTRIDKTISNTNNPPSNNVWLDLKYQAQTTEHNELISIKLNKEKSGKLPNEIFIQLKDSNGTWSVSKQISDTKAKIFEVELVDGMNYFEICAADSKSNVLPCEQEGISIMCGLVSPDPPLPYNIGIAKYFDDKEKDLFYPVKGLEKNRQFPAIGLFRIKTDKVLRKGEKGDCIFIPIYQGDYNATGTELSLYNLVCEVIITGKNLPDTLSEGSPVDITIEIDQSQQMYFSAFFPSLNYSEKLKIEINQLSVPSATNAVRQIANTRKEAERTEIDKLVQKQQIIAEKTQKLIEVIKSSLYELTQLLQDLRREDDFLEYCEANFNVFNWNNPTEARRLINKGLRLANSNQYDEVNLIIAQIKMLIITIPGGGDKS